MVGKTRSATQSQRWRMGKLRELGCIACRQRGLYRVPEVHHITERGRRLGHGYTIPLCAWCHRGTPDGNLAVSGMSHYIGPSLAVNKRLFVQTYGTELALLEQVDRLLLEDNDN